MMVRTWRKQKHSRAFGAFGQKWPSSKNARRKKMRVFCYGCCVSLGLENAEKVLICDCLAKLNQVLSWISLNEPKCKLLSLCKWIVEGAWLHDYGPQTGCT